MSRPLGVSPPKSMKVTPVHGKHPLYMVDDLLSKDECDFFIHLINHTETGKDHPLNKSWHAPGTGGHYDRVIRWEPEWAKILQERLRKVLPKEHNDYMLLYVNPCIRFSRYRHGGHFGMHRDGKNYDADGPDGYSTESLFTINIFLNDGFEGGATYFFHDDASNRFKVDAKPGRAAVFWAAQLHSGESVRETKHESFKYLMRTDVMGIRK